MNFMNVMALIQGPMFILAEDTASSSFSITNFLGGLKNTMNTWFGVVVIIFGLVLMLWGAWKTTQGLIRQGGHGGQSTNWLVVILCFAVGAIFFAGGFKQVRDVSSGIKNDVDAMQATDYQPITGEASLE